MGDKIEARGRDEERKGHKRTAASCFMRASRYYQTGERFIHPRSQRSMDVYAKSVKIFQDAAAILRDRRIEPVEVPYGTTSLPALLVHPDPAATGGKPAPCMVFFDGFDVTKELQYGYGVPDLAARGIGCLIVDGPGNGESVRFRNLPLIAETEHYATPVYEYLAARREFDPKRIGVMALSLGGYYAPRAASLEPRYACCVAWGAQWDYHAIWAKRLDELASGKVLSLSVPPEHLQWVLGVDSQAAALKKLEGFRLDGIVQKMTCPFLLLHGGGDEQIPLALAEKCFAAVGSKQKTLEGVPARGRRLPSLPGRQRHHRRALHVGLDRGRTEAGSLNRHPSRLPRLGPGSRLRMTVEYLHSRQRNDPTALSHRSRRGAARHRQGCDRGAGGDVRHLGESDARTTCRASARGCRAARST